MELAPGLAEAHVARGVAIALTRPEDASAEFETAIRLDPSKRYDSHYFYGRTLLAQGRHAEAAVAFEAAGQVRPDDYQAVHFASLAYSALGRTDEAIAAARKVTALLERHLELNPDDARAVVLGGVIWGRLGDRDRALEWTARALRLDRTDPVMCYNAACTYAVVGDSERALESLELAVRNGFVHREWLENDPDLNSIRDQPRFQTLLETCTSGRAG